MFRACCAVSLQRAGSAPARVQTPLSLYETPLPQRLRLASIPRRSGCRLRPRTLSGIPPSPGSGGVSLQDSRAMTVVQTLRREFLTSVSEGRPPEAGRSLSGSSEKKAGTRGVVQLCRAREHRREGERSARHGGSSQAHSALDSAEQFQAGGIPRLRSQRRCEARPIRPFCWRADCGSERLSALPKLTQQVRNRAEILFPQTQTLSGIGFPVAGTPLLS